ncbi:hypothetical protein PIB30_084706 [Stylosanthes scabra]|uniref:Uncharacterized protein n=1 Tax=Stylosanthes scabra TaxID=79078 RepID=A0ABU6SSV9_9FABA|nr:hypothetical protein [Stylosanthes scabra]
MPDPSAGHELMSRLASYARRLLGISPKYGFSTVDCHGIYQSDLHYPFEYDPYPRQDQLMPNPSPRKESGLIALIPY